MKILEKIFGKKNESIQEEKPAMTINPVEDNTNGKQHEINYKNIMEIVREFNERTKRHLELEDIGLSIHENKFLFNIKDKNKDWEINFECDRESFFDMMSYEFNKMVGEFYFAEEKLKEFFEGRETKMIIYYNHFNGNRVLAFSVDGERKEISFHPHFETIDLAVRQFIFDNSFVNGGVISTDEFGTCYVDGLSLSKFLKRNVGKKIELKITP